MNEQPKPHARNTGFAWTQPDGPFRRISEAQAQAYREQGFFVLEDAFSPEAVAAAIEAIDPLEAQTEAFLQTRDDGKLFIARAGEITFSPGLVTRSGALRDFCASPVFADLGHDLIGPDVRLYWDQAVYKKPGAHEEFPWHQDNGYTYIEPQQYLTCWVALTDATVENGCPWVAPGLHRLGTLEHWMTELGWCCLGGEVEAVPAPARAGSIVVFSSLTPHRTGPNRSDGVRKSYIVQFAPDGARRLELDGTTVTCDDPARQFEVLRAGAPLAPDASGAA
jgi:ectoine hydroxylase-related dioxygenase (phytanoyl-CoA dioxygenase family)